MIETPVETSTTTLFLYEGSDSFGALWSGLASEYDFTLDRTLDLHAWLERDCGSRIGSVGGVEEYFLATLGPNAELRKSPFAVVGADASHRTAVALMQAGASDYFALPGDLGLLRGWLQVRRQELADREARANQVRREELRYRFDGLIGTSEALRRALDLATRVIPHPAISVMIMGETGTGKELLARAVHFNGPRREAPFVDINCAAIPEQLLESELFGHERGAFTGATTSKPGLFEVARGGTIFLDEIGHLPFVLQGKLLRALDQRTIRRVGGTQTIAIDARVIAATHVDLPGAVQRGEFREDLFHRLNVLPIVLPPLRERGSDVVLLARHFLERFAASYELAVPTLTAEAAKRLQQHPWNGNIRELRNVIERAVILSVNERIHPQDLAFTPAAATPSASGVPFPATLREITRGAARAMVDRCGGNKSFAARRLDISRTRLLRLLGPATNLGDSEDLE